MLPRYLGSLRPGQVVVTPEIAPQAEQKAHVQAAERARDWDPNPETRAEIAAMLAANDRNAISAAFGGRIAFGTAGAARRRWELPGGPLIAGPALLQGSVGPWVPVLRA